MDLLYHLGMQLLLPAGEELLAMKHDMTADPGAKFVMFRRGTDLVSALFPFHKTHADIVEQRRKEDPTLQFLGAGFVLNNMPRWGSESCVKRMGVDRPAIKQQAECLRALRGALAVA